MAHTHSKYTPMHDVKHGFKLMMVVISVVERPIICRRSANSSPNCCSTGKTHNCKIERNNIFNEKNADNKTTMAAISQPPTLYAIIVVKCLQFQHATDTPARTFISLSKLGTIRSIRQAVMFHRNSLKIVLWKCSSTIKKKKIAYQKIPSIILYCVRLPPLTTLTEIISWG